MHMPFKINKLIELEIKSLTQTQSLTYPPYFGLALGYTFQLRICSLRVCVEEKDINTKGIKQKQMWWQYIWICICIYVNINF